MDEQNQNRDTTMTEVKPTKFEKDFVEFLKQVVLGLEEEWKGADGVTELYELPLNCVMYIAIAKVSAALADLKLAISSGAGDPH